MTFPKGNDVSSFQGAGFKWPEGMSFGMVKATEGETYANPDFAQQWGGLWEYDAAHHTPRFAYHFFHPKDPIGPQADLFVKTVKAHGLLPGDNLVMDYETTDALPAATAARNAVSFCHAVNTAAPDARVLVYTDLSMERSGACEGLGPWYLWHAEYGVKSPTVAGPWKEWTMWQHTDTPVDESYFNGTDSDLLIFSRMKVARVVWAR